MSGGRRESVGIFDYMVLYWVLKVMKAKGLSQEVIDRLTNLYSDNLTIVVVNNLHPQQLLVH